MAAPRKIAPAPPPDGRPQLELSGPALDVAYAGLLSSCEPAGGVERYVDALKAKSAIIREAFQEGSDTLSAERFVRVAGFMSTVRRRIDAYSDDFSFEAVRKPLVALLKGGEADERIGAFAANFPADGAHRWVRDLGAEILHHLDPERYPLMCRWVWDRKANSGVVREIWHGDIDHVTLDLPDRYETFLVLREELSKYLSASGVFRDIIWYVDLICAQVYSGYISAQGGSFLRADFSAAEDPAIYVRRLLGLDGVKAKSGRGDAVDVDEPPLLLLPGDRP